MSTLKLLVYIKIINKNLIKVKFDHLLITKIILGISSRTNTTKSKTSKLFQIGRKHLL